MKKHFIEVSTRYGKTSIAVDQIAYFEPTEMGRTKIVLKVKEESKNIVITCTDKYADVLHLINPSKSAPVFEKVPEGVYLFTLIDVKNLDSFSNWDDSRKSELPEWEDPTPQLGLLAKCEKGVVEVRLDGVAYIYWDDLTKKQKESGKYVQIGKYASYSWKKERLVISEDCERKQKLISIVDELFNALNFPEGSSIEDLQVAVKEKRQFQAKVVHVKEEGFSDQVKLIRFRKPSQSKAKNLHPAQRLDEFE